MADTIKAVIVAGGKGERLLPLTSSIPKSMIKIGRKPILEHIIRHLKHSGISEIILCLGYLHTVVQKYFGNGKKLGVKISYRIEKKPLGSAGAVRQIQKQLKNTFLVCYGDILRSLNIKDFIKFHYQKKGSISICVYKNHKANPKSLIEFDSNHQVKKFRERPNYNEKKWVWSNASMYLMEPKVFAYIPCGLADFAKDVFPEMIERGERIYAFEQKGYFLDIGTEESLNEAIVDYKRGKIYGSKIEI